MGSACHPVSKESVQMIFKPAKLAMYFLITEKVARISSEITPFTWADQWHEWLLCGFRSSQPIFTMLLPGKLKHTTPRVSTAVSHLGTSCCLHRLADVAPSAPLLPPLSSRSETLNQKRRAPGLTFQLEIIKRSPKNLAVACLLTKDFTY